ncbi:MAG: S46 family peptidase, partial [Bdellovibrionales bacterium]|nr:S46 family peptidase [Bdellovibrionales bacterium]
MFSRAFKYSRFLSIAAILLAGIGSSSFAEEGMWTLDDLPTKAIQSKYGVKLDDAWAKKVMQSSVRLGNGCSGSFVSSDGLVMTNHHCSRGCIFQLSTAKKNLLEEGFYAAKPSEEKQCPALEISRLNEIKDVTKEVHKALKGLKDKAYSDKLKEITARLEKECSGGSEKVRCDLVSLYYGGKYNLYKYDRFKDVRLVMAPDQAIGHFGGDPDNFNFPRYSFDVSFLRVYEDGKPLQNKEYFKWSKAGAKEGELTLITGHPGATQRLMTIAQLEYLRDVAYPHILNEYSEVRGMLTQYMSSGKEQNRRGEARLASVENTLKALKGRVQSLRDKEFFGKIKAEEERFRKKITSKSASRNKYGQAWSEIAKVVEKQKDNAMQ